MILYHWTHNADDILKEGFRDSTSHLVGTKGGTFFSPKLLDPTDGIEDELKLLSVDIPFKDIKQFEWIDEGVTYREFCIPADVVNQYKIHTPVVYRDQGISTVFSEGMFHPPGCPGCL